MILYRDFSPGRIPGGLLHGDRYETFERAVAAANAWITEQKVNLLTVETVVLPNIWSGDEEGTSDGEVETTESMTSINAWYQFLRVWYHA
jgi:hypothetical protein